MRCQVSLLSFAYTLSVALKQSSLLPMICVYHSDCSIASAKELRGRVFNPLNAWRFVKVRFSDPDY